MFQGESVLMRMTGEYVLMRVTVYLKRIGQDLPMNLRMFVDTFHCM